MPAKVEKPKPRTAPAPAPAPVSYRDRPDTGAQAPTQASARRMTLEIEKRVAAGEKGGDTGAPPTKPGRPKSIRRTSTVEPNSAPPEPPAPATPAPIPTPTILVSPPVEEFSQLRVSESGAREVAGTEGTLWALPPLVLGVGVTVPKPPPGAGASKPVAGARGRPPGRSEPVGGQGARGRSRGKSSGGSGAAERKPAAGGGKGK